VASIPAACNWKTLIEAFSETYHVQGIHREMLPMCDDVNGPQRLWSRHGKLEQSYGVASPRLRDRPDDQRVWEAFVEIMGERVGMSQNHNPGPAPEVPPGGTLRAVLADMVRERSRTRGVDLSSFPDEHVLDMHQYNLFPNVTVLVFGDMLSVVRSRPGAGHEEAFMDTFVFERRPAGDTSARAKPLDVVLPPDGELPVGLVLNQDVGNFARNQRGLHQPGLTNLALSPTEECRIVNLHRNLEAYLGL
jgi:choline monooxygenase